ncbi:hypothetical protein P5673_029469 [Acropora cervicornis]|uniref:Uncharacterized protein n=1 Tax=Acropora cervicornis TaxID=6130 RepID=A0AAD9PVW2_ACRCE|nr:hypothetical protein P5673_029469 [Acropora cervicornis]
MVIVLCPEGSTRNRWLGFTERSFLSKKTPNRVIDGDYFKKLFVHTLMNTSEQISPKEKLRGNLG